MTNTEKIAIRWLAAFSAAVSGATAVVLAVPGGGVPQPWVIGLLAVSGALSAFVAALVKPGIE